MLKIVEVRKSTNPNAKVAQDDPRFNLTSDGRKYIVLTLQDAENPLAPFRMRMLSQQFDSQNRPVWKVDINAILNSVGKEIPGEIVEMKVDAYKVGERMVDRYTAAIFKHENAEDVFLNAGHKPEGCTKPLPPRFNEQAVASEQTHPEVLLSGPITD